MLEKSCRREMQIIGFCPFMGEIGSRIALPLKSAFSSSFSILVKVVWIGRKEFLLVYSHDVIQFMAEERESAVQLEKKSVPAERLSNVMHCVAKAGFKFNACTCLHCKQYGLIPSIKYLHLRSLNMIFAVVVI